MLQLIQHTISVLFALSLFRAYASARQINVKQCIFKLIGHEQLLKHCIHIADTAKIYKAHMAVCSDCRWFFRFNARQEILKVAHNTLSIGTEQQPIKDISVVGRKCFVQLFQEHFLELLVMWNQLRLEDEDIFQNLQFALQKWIVTVRRYALFYFVVLQFFEGFTQHRL